PPAPRLAPRPRLSAPGDPPAELLDPGAHETDRAHLVAKGDLLGAVLEALLTQPLAPQHRPAAGRQQPPLPQTELREPLPIAHPIQPRILTHAHQVPRCLELRRGHRDRLHNPPPAPPPHL